MKNIIYFKQILHGAKVHMTADGLGSHLKKGTFIEFLISHEKSNSKIKAVILGNTFNSTEFL